VTNTSFNVMLGKSRQQRMTGTSTRHNARGTGIFPVEQNMALAVEAAGFAHALSAAHIAHQVPDAEPERFLANDKLLNVCPGN